MFFFFFLFQNLILFLIINERAGEKSWYRQQSPWIGGNSQEFESMASILGREPMEIKLRTKRGGTPANTANFRNYRHYKKCCGKPNPSFVSCLPALKYKYYKNSYIQTVNVSFNQSFNQNQNHNQISISWFASGLNCWELCCSNFLRNW